MRMSDSKGYSFILAVVLLVLIGCENPTSSTERVIGPAGGVVFYDKGDDSDGWRYLEAWLEDEDPGFFQYHVNNFVITESTLTSVGSGFENTYTAMAADGHPAAAVVRNATHGGFNDWFLPSKDELDLMYRNRNVIGGFSENNTYWSSSKGSENLAWIQIFRNGVQMEGNRGSDYSVRAVRRFKDNENDNSYR